MYFRHNRVGGGGVARTACLVPRVRSQVHGSSARNIRNLFLQKSTFVIFTLIPLRDVRASVWKVLFLDFGRGGQANFILKSANRKSANS
jgi:hypothetical protein